MIYPISKSLLSIVLKHKQVTAFLDPFMGSGTTLIEAKLSGIPQVYGTDLNPLAVLLSEVKTTNLSNEQLQYIKSFEEIISKTFDLWNDIIVSFDKYIRVDLELDITSKKDWGNNAGYYIKEFGRKHRLDLNTIINFKNMGYWFLPKVVMSLQAIKQEINKITDIDVKKFILVAFSETVRLVSNTRNGEFKLFRMKPERVLTFDPDVKAEFLKVLKHNVNKIKQFDALNKGSSVKTHIYLEDARTLEAIPDNSIDLVITSPPYGDSRTTVAYGQYSRLALYWLELDNVKEDDIVQLDRNLLGGRSNIDDPQWTVLGSKTLENSLKKIADKDAKRAKDVFSFYRDLSLCLQAISKKTKSGGYHFWVVGNRTVKLENLRTDEIIIELAHKHGLEFVYNFGRRISNKVMPRRNSPTNEGGVTAETMTKEHIIVLRKVN
jgi:site-specific DNA-adenine methylase